MTERRRKYFQKMENVGKAEVLLKYGNKKSQKKIGEVEIRKAEKIKEAEIMAETYRPTKRKETENVAKTEIFLKNGKH